MPDSPTPPPAPSAGVVLRLYHRVVLGTVAAILVVRLVHHLTLAATEVLSVEVTAVYAAVLLLAWLGYELARAEALASRRPNGALLGLTALLLVLLCLETGGLASPVYMLLFATGVAGALVLDVHRAVLLASATTALYAAGAWAHAGSGVRPLVAGPSGVLEALLAGPILLPDAVSALIVQAGFLLLGTLIALKFASAFRARVAQLSFDAHLDPLTALPNRRGFTEKLQHEEERIIQLNWPVTMLVLDLDHFKRVNDRFDHQVGDTVLQETARLLRDATGPLDHVARLGGEEFAVAAVGVDRGQARDLADRIVRLFRSHDWNAVREGLGPITISIGVAVRPPVKDVPGYLNLDALLQAADHALLRVKRNGRDGFLLAGDATVPPTLSGTLPVRRVTPGSPLPRARFIRPR